MKKAAEVQKKNATFSSGIRKLLFQVFIELCERLSKIFHNLTKLFLVLSSLSELEILENMYLIKLLLLNWFCST